MFSLSTIRTAKKPRIGLYTVGLQAYWASFQFKERLIEYGKFIENRMSAWGEIHNFGIVDTEGAGRNAGEWLNERNVNLVLCHAATYSTSSMSCFKFIA